MISAFPCTLWQVAGDGDVPHDCIGGARRMMVKRREEQHHTMTEAVQVGPAPAHSKLHAAVQRAALGSVARAARAGALPACPATRPVCPPDRPRWQDCSVADHPSRPLPHRTTTRMW